MIKPRFTFTIMLPVYEKVDLLDVAGPHELLSLLSGFWPGTTLHLYVVGDSMPDGTPRPVTTSSGLTIVPNKTFDDCEKEKLQADLVLVPGGLPASLPTRASACRLFCFLDKQIEDAEFVTSVCTGALVLNAGGYLDYCTATTHWCFLNKLRANPTITIPDGYPRYVSFTPSYHPAAHSRYVGKTFITGGGISSGLDAALFIAQTITGQETIAREVQLAVQYNPHPPKGGDPSVSPVEIVLAVESFMLRS